MSDPHQGPVIDAAWLDRIESSLETLIRDVELYIRDLAKVPEPLQLDYQERLFLYLRPSPALQQDVADARALLKALRKLKSEVPYGCHVDLEPGEEPDGCVLDEGCPEDCIYASRISCKEECSYWRPKPIRLES